VEIEMDDEPLRVLLLYDPFDQISFYCDDTGRQYAYAEVERWRMIA